MIGVAGEDCHGPVQLLGKHHPDELMRPRHFAKSEAKLGFFEKLRAMAVGAADCEDDVARAAVPPAGDPVGKGGARQVLALLVEGDEGAALAEGGDDRRGLLGLAGLRRASPAFGEFANGEGESRRGQAR